MPETPEELWQRVHDELRAPPVADWDTWPFEGEVKVRPLEPPVEKEPARFGEGGVDCLRCATPDDEYLWTSDNWRLHAFDRPSGLPLVVLLEAREHFAAASTSIGGSWRARPDCRSWPAPSPQSGTTSSRRRPKTPGARTSTN